MKKIKVYGELKKYLKQGTFYFDVNTAAEALKALCANFDGLEKWFIDNDQNGIAYKVKLGKEQISEENIETLSYPFSSKEVFSISPVITGAGRGFGRFLTGALLIGASFLIPGTWAIGTFGSSMGAIGVARGIRTIGILMTLSGAAEMLSPQPGLPETPTQLQSFSISGVHNVANVGSPIPIVMGRAFCGSVIVSAGLDVDQVS